jgi:cation:H+ antiporter
MIGASLVLVACLLDGRLGRDEGALLLAGIMAYTVFRIRRAPRERNPGLVKEFESAVQATRNGILLDLLLIVAGVGLLAIGAHFLVAGALELAQILGISDATIAITVVAVGTTLPELITSLVAAARKAPDIAVGNIIGSNIFNILCVLGTAATLRPLDVPNIGSREIAAFLVMAFVAWPVMTRGLRVTRLEGLALVCSYLLMLGWMIA